MAKRSREALWLNTGLVSFALSPHVANDQPIIKINLVVTEIIPHAPLNVLISLSVEARNSWGSGWGENGYVKVARLGGAKGHHGVCGIAHSPSVALGGTFTRDVEIERFGDYMSPGRFFHDGSKPDRTMMARASYQIHSALQ